MNQIALPTSVADMVAEHDEKSQALEGKIAAMKAAIDDLKMTATVQGVYVGSVIDREPYVHLDNAKSNLLQSGWRAVYKRLNVEAIASAKDIAEFERALSDPPPLTIENVVATFRKYFDDPRFHILRGLAEAFVDLDPAYKSHSKVKVGKDKLPKRIIISNCSGFASYGEKRLHDVINAVAAVRGQPRLSQSEQSYLREAARYHRDAVFDGRKIPDTSYPANRDGGTTLSINRDLEVRFFMNGNGHVHFGKIALTDINRGLAEFYGDILPDVEPEEGAKKRASTAVSKDLQFYWTPASVAEQACEAAHVLRHEQYAYGADVPIKYVLEPSCGEGHILDVLKGRAAKTFGVEVDPVRAAKARAKGHVVQVANFLELPPSAVFDAVVMNPPFYGQHYAKHVRHALKFLKPGGTLATILPASAWYDHDALAEFKTGHRWGSPWKDLPVASFAESGTNVPTGILTIIKPSQAQEAAA